LAGQKEITLQPLDVLLIYSDGIPEAASTSGEFFGEQRLLAVVKKNGRKSPVELREAILSALAEFSPGEMLMDDQTLLVIKRSENL
jgi:sigma-B regulation protein RsbU (phosphoserine phosphatase)